MTLSLGTAKVGVMPHCQTLGKRKLLYSLFLRHLAYRRPPHMEAATVQPFLLIGRMLIPNLLLVQHKAQALSAGTDSWPTFLQGWPQSL